MTKDDSELNEIDSALDAIDAMGLVQVLRALPKKEFQSLIGRVDAAVDPAKRIDVPSQVARVLLTSAELREPSRLGRASAELLVRLAEARGRMTVESAPTGLEPLVKRGLVFARKAKGGIDLVFPVALMLQMKAWDGDDPRSARALLAQASQEVATSIASHYLGRPVAPPIALVLEEAWAVLANEERLADELVHLPPLERKLLHAVEEVGGEVDTEELLVMEREPVRIRGASGATPSRRGVGFALERRGFLIPVHPNRHVIPTEVTRLVGAERLAERESLRRQIREKVASEDYIPQRARFAQDVVPFALGIAMAVHGGEAEVRAGVGTPKSLISKMATRFGRAPETVAVVAALSRIAGIWDEGATTVDTSPGQLVLEDVGALIFETWRRGAAWDESRPDGELLRAQGEAREAGAAGVVRNIVVEVLQELGDGQWAPWGAIEDYLRADPRTPGLTRMIERSSAKFGFDLAPPIEIARRMAVDTLHILGAVDLASPDEGDGVVGPMLRITPRGRVWLSGGERTTEPRVGKFIDNQTLRVGSAVTLSCVLELNALTEVGNVEGDLDLILTPRTLALAIGTGIDPSILRGRLEAVAALPDPIQRQLAQASAVLGRAEFVEGVGFIWIDDPEVRRMLSTRRSTADLFVNPSPPSGLLVAPGVDLDKLSRRCRTLGVEILDNGKVHFASATPASRRSRKDGPPSSSKTAAKSGVRAKAASSKTASPRARTSSKPALPTKTPATRRRKTASS